MTHTTNSSHSSRSSHSLISPSVSFTLYWNCNLSFSSVQVGKLFGHVKKIIPLFHGYYKTVTIDCLEELEWFLNNKEANQCISLGTFEDAEGIFASQSIINKEKKKEEEAGQTNQTIQTNQSKKRNYKKRNAENVKFREKYTLAFLDIDKNTVSIEEAISILDKKIGLVNIKKCILPSSSNGIMKDGKPVSNNTNFHVYFFMESDKVVNFRAAINKLNHIEELPFHIDSSVLSASRIDFIGQSHTFGKYSKVDIPAYIIEKEETVYDPTDFMNELPAYYIPKEITMTDYTKADYSKYTKEFDEEEPIYDEDGKRIDTYGFNYPHTITLKEEDIVDISGIIMTVKDLLDNLDIYNHAEVKFNGKVVGWVQTFGGYPWLWHFDNDRPLAVFSRHVSAQLKNVGLRPTNISSDYYTLPSIEEAREEVKEEIEKFIDKTKKRFVHNLFLRISPGIGKSHTLLKIAKKRKNKILYFVPNIDLAVEFAELYDATIIKGRNKLCELKEWEKPEHELLMADMCKTCKKRATCEYYKQFEDVKDIVILSQNYLTCVNSKIKELADRSDYIVIDEDAVPVLLREIKQTTNNDTLMRLYMALSSTDDTANVLRAFETEIRVEYHKIRTIGPFNEEKMTFREYLEEIKRREFWRELLRIAETRDGFYRNNVWTSEEIIGHLKITSVTIGKTEEVSSIYDRLPLLYLDGTGNPYIVKHVVRNMKVVDIKANYHKDFNIVQFTGSTMSKNKVKEKMKHISRKYKDIFTKSAVITYKDYGSPYYFGKIRGTNKLKDVDSLVVLGRHQIPSDVLENYCRTIFSISPYPIDFRRDFDNLTVHGKGIEMLMTKNVYGGKEISACYNHFNTAETTQAVFRKRPYHKGGTVYLLTNEVLDDIYVSEVVNIANVFPRIHKAHNTGTVVGDMLSKMLAENDGYMIWSPSKLANAINERLKETGLKVKGKVTHTMLRNLIRHQHMKAVFDIVSFVDPKTAHKTRKKTIKILHFRSEFDIEVLEEKYYELFLGMNSADNLEKCRKKKKINFPSLGELSFKYGDFEENEPAFMEADKYMMMLEAKDKRDFA
jgi:hypothetical protein